MKANQFALLFYIKQGISYREALLDYLHIVNLSAKPTSISKKRTGTFQLTESISVLRHPMYGHFDQSRRAHLR